MHTSQLKPVAQGVVNPQFNLSQFDPPSYIARSREIKREQSESTIIKVEMYHECSKTVISYVNMIVEVNILPRLPH